MIRRTILMIAVAGIYVWMRRRQQAGAAEVMEDHEAQASWASEGGANPATSV